VHEASVALRILDTVEGIHGIRAVFVTVGRHSCVHPDMLRVSFNALKAGTAAAQAELVVIGSPGDDIRVHSIEVEDENTDHRQKHIR
jgi:Zn finger protein HypA/HybF involved in hydrogenase expression